MEPSRRCGAAFRPAQGVVFGARRQSGIIGPLKNSLGTAGIPFSNAGHVWKPEPISQMRGGQISDPAERVGAFGARRSAVDATTRNVLSPTSASLDGRRVRRPQPRAEVLQPVRNGEGRLAHVLRLNIKPLEVRGRQALRAVDGAT